MQTRQVMRRTARLWLLLCVAMAITFAFTSVAAAQLPEAALSIVAEVSVDGGDTWHDANDAPGPFTLYVPSEHPRELRLRYRITNTGAVPLTDVSLVDVNGGNRLCGAPGYALPAGDWWHVYDYPDWSAGQFEFVPEVTGWYGEVMVTASDPVHYFGAAPGMSVEKYVGTSLAGPWSEADSEAETLYVPYGEVPVFRIAVSNTGNVLLDRADLSDSNGRTFTFVPVPLPGPVAAAYGIPWTAGAGVNTVVVAASYIDDGGRVWTDEQTDQACYSCGFNVFGRKLNGDTDQALPGWTVQLHRLNSPGPDVPVTELVAETVTGAGGVFSFDNLPAGTYILSEVEQQGWRQIYPETGYHLINLPPAPGDESREYLFINGQLGSIGDRVWWDYDHDGIQDEQEDGVADVIVELHACDGDLISSTTTAVDGLYHFDDLVPDDYRLRFLAPTGHEFTQPNAGDDAATDSDAWADGWTPCTTLEPGENDLELDAGIYEEWREADSATGVGVRITTRKKPTSNTWFMYNCINDSSYAVHPGSEPALVGQFPIQAGNPADGENVIGRILVYRTAAQTYTIHYELVGTPIERNGSLWAVIDADDNHLSAKDLPNFLGVPGKDDNADFGVPFIDADGVFYFFAHIVVNYK